jgi:hypothetical protein
VTDRLSKRSFTDDPAPNASLNALDRGLLRDEDDARDAPLTARAERRALLDLFPSSEELGFRPPGPIGGERPPGPLIGTAVGPHLVDRRVPTDAEPASLDDPPTDESLYDIDLFAPPADITVLLPRTVTAFVLAALTLAGAAGALWVFRDAVARTIQQWERVPAPPGEPTGLLPQPLTPSPPPTS